MHNAWAFIWRVKKKKKEKKVKKMKNDLFHLRKFEMKKKCLSF